jgi:tetratricopeptide (TPR) repeat protein
VELGNHAELWVNRAEIDFRSGDVPQAIIALKNAVHLDPSNCMAHCQLAALCASTGDAEMYQQACSELLARFGSVPDWPVCGELAKVCLLRANDALSKQVALLVDRLPVELPDRNATSALNLVRGMVSLRRNAFDVSRTCFEKCLLQDFPDRSSARFATAYAYNAMAEWELGNSDKARESLSDAINMSRDEGYQRDHWYEWSIAHLAIQEAQRLIGIVEK